MKKFVVGLVSIILLSGCNLFNNASTTSDNSFSNNQTSLTPKEVQKTWTPSFSTSQKVESLINSMDIYQKAGQMLQVERASLKGIDIKTKYIGSVLSGGGSIPGSSLDSWVNMYHDFQNNAMTNDLAIPIIYGIDAVHGNNNVYGATIFPHNIGLGAANNPELMYEIAKITANEMKVLGHFWDFAPCLASVQDIRWGRSYESYSEDPLIVDRLAIPYIQGLQDQGVLATAKHYILDGFTVNGVDQGNAIATEQVIKEVFLPSYTKAIKAGVKTIMISYSSINSQKMHENKYWINDILKEELQFKGIVISDYNAVVQLSGKNLYEKVVNGVNSGIDMIMEANGDWLNETWQEIYAYIIEGYNKKDISIDRINDAVRRILSVKIEMNLIDEYKVAKPSSSQFRQPYSLEIARQAVAESLVLLKNAHNVLPLKKDANILLLGPARDNIGIQSGGWTISWQGLDKRDLTIGTTILEAFKQTTTGKIFTDISDASKASVAVVVIGEKPYAEGMGYSNSLRVDKDTGLDGNLIALQNAKNTGLPVVVIMISGRPLLINDYINDWDGLVAAWLPGTEGLGISDVIFGDRNFKGKLPVTWPKTINEANHSIIMDRYRDTNYDDVLYQFPYGYGLTYAN